MLSVMLQLLISLSWRLLILLQLRQQLHTFRFLICVFDVYPLPDLERFLCVLCVPCLYSLAAIWLWRPAAAGVRQRF
jgi:hypothetical protein